MQKRLEALLNEVSKSPVIDNGDLNKSAQMILQAVMEGLQVNRCGIWLFDETFTDITCFLLNDHTLSEPVEGLVLKRSDFPKYFEALDEERVIAANNAFTAKETSEFAIGYLDVLDIHAMLDTPIRHSGKTVGIICSEHRGQPREWVDDEIVFTGVLSDLCGRAINAKDKRVYEQKLIETNKNLESTVLQRTQHLNDTIDELKSIQDKLIESEKMAALGNMVAGIAHEVNTPLGIALTACSHIKDEIKKIQMALDQQSMTKSHLQAFFTDADSASDMCITSLTKAATLISNFKRTSADQTHFEKETINIKEYIEKVLTTLTPITKKLAVDVYVTGDEIKAGTYPGAISQIVTNFITNSCHHGFTQAFSGRPKITICVSQNDDMIMLDYSDNGVGMTEDVRKSMFDPFFTTKRHEGGTGLGLPIVHALITKKLNGKIGVESVPMKGTKLNLTFPAI